MFYRDLFHLFYVLQYMEMPKYLKWLDRRRSSFYIFLQMQSFCILFILPLLNMISGFYDLPEEWERGWPFLSLLGFSLVINLWLMYFRKNSWMNRPAEITNWSIARGTMLALAIFGFGFYQFYL